MSLFDRLSEDLTDMMDDVTQYADPRCKALLKRLEASHVEACQISRDLRAAADGQAAAAAVRQRRVA
jgi:hypothetical protein